jgi:hypothetical protein
VNPLGLELKAGRVWYVQNYLPLGKAAVSVENIFDN